MNQPKVRPGQGQANRDTAPVALDGAQVIQGIHDRYTNIIAQTLQENAELHAALTSVQRENAQLNARVAALTKNLPTLDAPAASAG